VRSGPDQPLSPEPATSQGRHPINRATPGKAREVM